MRSFSEIWLRVDDAACNDYKKASSNYLLEAFNLVNFKLIASE
ncbi:MAG: hypothetical protein AAF267_09040 [Deinococcota bacterium]